MGLDNLDKTLKIYIKKLIYIVYIKNTFIILCNMVIRKLKRIRFQKLVVKIDILGFKNKKLIEALKV